MPAFHPISSKTGTQSTEPEKNSSAFLPTELGKELLSMTSKTDTGASRRQLDSISSKHLSELEQLIMQLVKTMRSARLQHYPIYTSLRTLERDLGEIRRKRYDENHSAYDGY